MNNAFQKAASIRARAGGAPKAGKFSARKSAGRRVWAKFKHLVCAAAIAGTLMVPHAAKAEEAGPEKPKMSGNVGAIGGAYEKGGKPFVGMGLSGALEYLGAKFGLGMEMIFAKFGSAELGSAEASVTIPSSVVSIAPYIYRSQYWAVDLGVGAAVGLPHDLGLSAEWCSDGTMPVTAFWAPSVGRAGFGLKAVAIPNHGMLPKPAPFIGGELSASWQVIGGVGAYAKGFAMPLRGGQGNFSLGVLNVQAGISADF
jgi:hypothetical protein